MRDMLERGQIEEDRRVRGEETEENETALVLLLLLLLLSLHFTFNKS